MSLSTPQSFNRTFPVLPIIIQQKNQNRMTDFFNISDSNIALKKFQNRMTQMSSQRER